MSEIYPPGKDNVPVGEYVEVGPRGGEIKDAKVTHIDKGDRLPPTSEKGRKWKKN